MEHPPLELDAAGKRVLQRLRRTCMAYPEVREVSQFGRPFWKAGDRSFAALGDDDGLVFWINLPVMDQEGLLAMGPFRKAPYIGKHGWTLVPARGPDWPLVEDLINTAYRKVAKKRMLAALGDA